MSKEELESMEYMHNMYKMYQNNNAYIPLQDLERYRQAYKKYIWHIYHSELHNHCKNCQNLNILNHEKRKCEVYSTHRCKALATDHKDEYGRGYYPILYFGQVCPMTNKPITSKTIGQVMKIANEW